MEKVSTTNSFKVYINDVDYTKYTPFPIKWSEYLDERLDEGRLSMKHMPVPHFPMFSDVRFEIADKRGNSFVKNFVLASDASSEIINQNVYNHEITLVEQTKVLERIIVDSITFTNNLGRDYTKDATPVNFVEDGKGSSDYFITPVPAIKSPIKEGVITLPSPNSVWKKKDNKNTLISTELIIFIGREPIYEVGGDDVFSQQLGINTYRARYWARYENSLGLENNPAMEATFTVLPYQAPLPKLNIRQVIERVLDVAETHLASEQPRYKLNAEQAAEFEQIESPEFAFTRSTLKEVLDQIGGFIHGIPRLEGDTIYYDMLGGVEIADFSGLEYVSKISSQNVEDYATKLDSTMENLVSVVDREQGAVVDPYINGYKTVRTEKVYARIEEGNLCIETQYPIYDIISVKCGYLPTAINIKGGDLTPYVYEAADYARLSSYDEAYPNSRAYALYYTQGQPDINGLDFRVPDVKGGVFSRYAIANILKATSAQDIGSPTIWSSDTYPRLSFQVSYIPIFSSRLGQHKSYIGDFEQPSELIFNQGANLVETKYYGENLKGTIARMGNTNKSITYITSYTVRIPKVGQLFDEEYYISSVAVEYMPNYFYMTLELSKDFNRLSQYIGINSQRRYYEVSEKQAYNRDILYTDYCVIGDKVEPDTTLVTDTALKYVMRTIQAEPMTRPYQPVSNVMTQGESAGTTYAPISLAAISIAAGNSMVFGYRYEDNYSTGNRSGKSSNGNVSGYFTQGVAYGDYYGRFDNLQFKYMNGQRQEASFPFQTGIGQALPFWLPLGPQTSDTLIEASEGNSLVVRKDGREALSMNYQLEFVTNRRAIVIGSALSRDCPLVKDMGDTAQYASLFILPKRFAKFADKIDLTGAMRVVDYNLNSPNLVYLQGRSIVFVPMNATTDGAAWVIVNSNTGELYFGENTPIKSGEAINLPTMTFRHNIYNL